MKRDKTSGSRAGSVLAPRRLPAIRSRRAHGMVVIAAILLTAAAAFGQVSVDHSGADGFDGGFGFPTGENGGDGGGGAPADASNAAAIDTVGVAITVRSGGGNGGDGGTGSAGIFGFGGDGGGGGNSGAITVTNTGALTTTGDQGHGILAEAVAGSGGGGGEGIGASSVGGDGGRGGTGGNITVLNDGGVATSGLNAQGILIQSLGGAGGEGGDGLAVVGFGGSAAGSGPGGGVSLANTGGIHSGGAGSNGILAQSVGGFAGAGGGAVGLLAFGAGGESAGDGGAVTANNSGAITTEGDDAFGLFVQSVGGGGGFGGTTGGIVSLGGSGNAGGDGALVTLNNFAGGDISTSGDRSTAILAQSVGGGGGDGGNAVATGIFVSCAIGGSGGSGGDGGGVNFNTANDGSTPGVNLVTHGDRSAGLKTQSVGGGGGNAGFAIAGSVGQGFSASLSVGGSGGDGGAGGLVNAKTNGTIATEGADAMGVFAQSVGGGGGDGGFSIALAGSDTAAVSLAVGGSGGDGGDAGAVGASIWSDVSTLGDRSHAVEAQSVGGGGGNGGFSVSVAAGGEFGGSLALGGAGGGGGAGESVTVDSEGTLVTEGELACGVLAQSVGGGGGEGGFSLSGSGGCFAGAVSVGGSGDAGGWGGDVSLRNAGNIATSGGLAYGLQAQSVGGGGGSGGFSIGAGLSAGGGSGAALNVAVGGSGGLGSAGGDIQVVNEESITTSGVGSHAIFAQSAGGGGGSGGFAGSLAGSIGTTASISVGVGGSGGTGGAAGSVTVDSTGGRIETTNGGASGIHAQSVGGGGGDGGFGLSAALGTGDKSLNLNVAVGGTGGAGGTGGSLNINNFSEIATSGSNTSGILAQSVGGGGGTGGFAASLTGSASANAKELSVGVGGSGGTGNDAGRVTVANANNITAQGLDRASGITAQSVGGGGGRGGLSFSGSLSSYDSKQLTVSIGGSGGVGGDGGVVEVSNDNGAISTSGTDSAGILAQSVGGGGGDGGMAISGMLGLGGAGTNVNLAATVGGSGGVAGTGDFVSVTNNDTIVTTGLNSSGIYAQSVGGGGGVGGSTFTGVMGVASSTPQADQSRTVNASLNVGGGGGDGNHGGAVRVTNTSAVTTGGGGAYGVFAQSVGGGGGEGGRANTVSLIVGKKPEEGQPDTQKRNFNLTALIGGSGGGASNGGAVTVQNTGNIETSGENAAAIFAQSVGGGGGAGGNGIIGSGEISPVPVEMAFIRVSRVQFLRNVKVAVGGDAGSSGDGGTVSVVNGGSIATRGQDSHGVFAQSVGGGGGAGGNSNIGAMGTVGLGGTGGAAGNGGDVTVSAGSGLIETHGAASYGVFAQSVGGGGGVAGNVKRALAAEKDVDVFAVPSLNLGVGVALGQGGGDGGDGGNVAVSGTGDIITHEVGSHGIFAQSVGGGGGILGTLGNELLTALDFSDTDIGADITRLGGFIGSMGDAGSGGAVDVQYNGNIVTYGEIAHGILAQSAGGEGTGASVSVTVNGEIRASGADAYGILAQSVGLAGNGNITIDVAGGVVEGGSDTGAGVRFDDGAVNTLTNRGAVTSVEGALGAAIYGTAGSETINNFGTIVGSVNLGGNSNSFNNMSGATFDSGEIVLLNGAANLLANDGALSPGGSGSTTAVLTTELDGSLVQTSNGVYELDLDFVRPNAATGLADCLDISGTADFDGSVAISIVNANQASPGVHEVTIATVAGGLTGQSLDLDAPASAVAEYGVEYPDSQTVVLTYDIDFCPSGMTFNQTAFGGYINEVQLAGGSASLAPVIGQIFNLATLPELQDAYDQMIGDVYGSLRIVGLQNTTSLYQLLSNQLSPRGYPMGGASGGSSVATRLAPFSSETPSSASRDGCVDGPVEESGGRFAERAGATVRGQGGCNCGGCCDPACFSWAAGYGLGGNVQSDSNAAELSYSTGGAVVGVQNWLDQGAVGGLFVSYDRECAKTESPDQRADVNSVQLGGYLRSENDCGHYFILAAAGALDFYDTRRRINFGSVDRTASAGFTGEQGSVYLERGFAVCWGACRLQPLAALQYVHMCQGAFEETGAEALNLAVDAVDTDSLRGILGGRMSCDLYSWRAWRITPELQASWMHEFLQTDSVLAMRLGTIGVPGYFAPRGLKLGRDWALAGFHLNLSPRPNVSLSAGYDLQVNRCQTFHGGSGGLNLVW